MFNKKVGISILLWIIIMIIIAILTRNSFQDDTSQNIDKFQVAEWSDALYNEQEDQMLQKLPEANIILRVKASGKSTISFRCIKQSVTVLESFKGNSLKQGTEIDIMWESAMAIFPEKYLNMGFVNFMKADHEYLIFLDKKIEPPEYKNDNTWTLALSELFIAPIFDYDMNRINVQIPISDSENRYVLYEQVKENEFFVEDEKSLNHLLEVKEKLLNMYPREKKDIRGKNI